MKRCPTGSVVHEDAWGEVWECPRGTSSSWTAFLVWPRRPIPLFSRTIPGSNCQELPSWALEPSRLRVLVLLCHYSQVHAGNRGHGLVLVDDPSAPRNVGIRFRIPHASKCPLLQLEFPRKKTNCCYEELMRCLYVFYLDIMKLAVSNKLP